MNCFKRMQLQNLIGILTGESTLCDKLNFGSIENKWVRTY